MKKFKKSRFTLIELLAVIALLSVLITLFAPAFSRMMVGSKVDQMASNFKTGMEMAQSKAVASGKYVAMILPACYSTEITDSKLKSFCNGGFRFAFVKMNADGKWIFNGWVPGSAWSNMVDGAMLVGIQKRRNWLNDEADFKGDLLSLSDLKKTPSGAAAGLEKSVSKAFTGGENATVKIEIDGSSDPDVDSIKTANLRGIIFDPASGCVGDGVPLIMFFTEARVNGNEYDYTNVDNFVMLKLNPLTGKVVHLPMEDGE